ncbi:peptidoglycan-associated lipoprotein Pal [Thiolapillus sp.]|uniref:Peptidoglycan-associated lipoprotein n=5 Tax=Thiolapillus TaxID=1608298 RepID=A0A831RT89_9GAMM|nr:peptidoglycan-associated lipoprotein Pal [Thiolapillus sp.]HEC05296.1 peptidoglycan-associated lipoprotein Pal [Thiolapillus brandeum]
MKKTMFLLLTLIFSMALLSGCSSTGGPQDEEGAGTEMGGGSGTNTSAAGGGGAWTGSPLEDPNSPLYEKVVYFDFDTAEIRPEYVDTLRAHAEYLVNTPSARLVIEGHCDERGSREYNIALGERRADSVKRFLEAEGVSPVQLETVSYGEERPVDLGHNEEAWAKNRRAELVYQ